MTPTDTHKPLGNDASTDPLLEGLTEPQREAVQITEGPLLVLAGAGSGKTRVITRRIAYLVLKMGIAPWNILAITFTNKAAGEMRQRVATLVSEDQSRKISVHTFHALCARILRIYGDRLGLPPGYSIYDTGDQQRAIKQALEELQMNSENFPPAKVLSTISSAKNELVDEEAYAKKAFDFNSKNIAKIYKKYQQILQRSKAMDFDDLMLKTVQLIREHPEALAQLQERFQYILIDEYQDTNHAQFVIASALAAKYKNICATGDPDQSIYGWRGANIRNILEFETHYPNASVVRLEQNYRSTKRILAVADKLISRNTQRKHKSLWTENETGDKITIAMCQDEHQEAQWVVDRMRKLHDEENITWGQMAIFYRMNSLSRVMEEALRKASVPYQIARGTAFYERKEIKDALAYLRVIVNQDDEVNLQRIINTPPRGISPATVKSLQAEAVTQGVNFPAMLTRAESVVSINTRAVACVQKFAKELEKWRLAAGLDPDADNMLGEHAQPSLKDFVEVVLRESGMEQACRNDKADPDQERLANLGELVSSAAQFEQEYNERTTPEEQGLGTKLAAYLEQVSLVSDVDAIEADQGAVTLMTLHAAKGLEFPVVAIVAVEDGLLPHQRANHSPTEMEEERRLCFVGITRAQRFLSLSYARYRTIFGQTLPTIPSRFLREMPSEHLEETDMTEEVDQWGRSQSSSFGATRSAGITPGFTPISGSRKTEAEHPSGLRNGDLVRHPMFGVGRILSISSGGAHSKVQVKFTTAGLRTLILEYAKLQKCED